MKEYITNSRFVKFLIPVLGKSKASCSSRGSIPKCQKNQSTKLANDKYP